MRITGTLHEDLCSFVFLSRRILLRMRNALNIICREVQNAHFVFNNFVFSFENRAVFERMWKNMIEPDRPQMTV